LSGAARLAGRVALLAALALTLAGCHTTRVVWAKPGGGDAALQSDLQGCADQARAAPPGYFNNRILSATTDPQFAAIEAARPQVNCMIGRGWRLTPVP
jgi:hypothetical protein